MPHFIWLLIHVFRLYAQAVSGVPTQDRAAAGIEKGQHNMDGRRTVGDDSSLLGGQSFLLAAATPRTVLRRSTSNDPAVAAARAPPPPPVPAPSLAVEVRLDHLSLRMVTDSPAVGSPLVPEPQLRPPRRRQRLELLIARLDALSLVMQTVGGSVHEAELSVQSVIVEDRRTERNVSLTMSCMCGELPHARLTAHV